jgi:small-conductance mechanosensitive channel
MDRGLREAIGASFGYVGVMIAALAGLAQLGVGFDKLAIVAGALSVGIGFGLQSIVSNFVSGLIVLWERAIRVGDWIAVGGEEGYVRRINVRSTEIETFDRVLVSMPNANLVSGVVKNWVRGDKGGRVKLRVPTRRDADPEAVRALLTRVAKAHEAVQGIPAPRVNFLSFDQAALHFELVAHIADVEMAVRVKSDLTFATFDALREADLLTPITAAAASADSAAAP